MSSKPPPFNVPFLDSKQAMALQWVDYIQSEYNGDGGTSWAPGIVGLTVVGTPTLEGRYYQLSSYLAYFYAKITPATSTSSVAGTTYINNFPLTPAQDTLVNTVWNITGGIGTFAASANRIYLPAWSAITVPVTISGMVLTK